MVTGFNSSVTHDGIEYHVQTEDLGEKNPCILTLVYLGGAIVSREKVSYPEVLGGQTSPARIKTFMEEQHQRILQHVACDGLEMSPASPPLPSSSAVPPELPKSVDDLIAEYLHRRKRGSAD
jgi:hypothetical protein